MYTEEVLQLYPQISPAGHRAQGAERRFARFTTITVVHAGWVYRASSSRSLLEWRSARLKMVAWLAPTVAMFILAPLLPCNSRALRAQRLCHAAMASKGGDGGGDSSDAGGAFARRRQLDDEVRALGGAYASVDAFVADQLPASRQPKHRRRHKEWDPSRRSPSRREERAAKRAALSPKEARPSPKETLCIAQAALASAAVAIDLEMVGVVLARPGRGPKEAGAFKCWVDAKGDARTLTADDLGHAAVVLRDALWVAIPGRPDITVTAGGSTRPLFSSEDLRRFCGARVQIVLREPVGGRRRLLGELLGLAEVDGVECAMVLDESAGEERHAPVELMRLGEPTCLLPADYGAMPTKANAAKANAAKAGAAKAGAAKASGLARGARGAKERARKREGVKGRATFKQAAATSAVALERFAAETVDEALVTAPVVVFGHSDCEVSSRAVELLRAARSADGMPWLHVVDVDRCLPAHLATTQDAAQEAQPKVRPEALAKAGAPPLPLLSLDARAVPHAIQYELMLRTGRGERRSALPLVLMGGVSDGSDACQGAYNGWAGGVEELEALVAAGPGRLQSRLLEASWSFARRASPSVDALE